MKEVARLFVVTLFFIGVFAYSLTNLELEEIRKQWNSRRCEPLVMTMAHLVPKEEDLTEGKTRSDFSTENFNFCINQYIDSSLSLALTPFLKLFTQAIDTTKPINASMNTLKTNASSFLSPFTSMMEGTFGKLKQVSQQGLRVFYNLLTSFDRIFGIATASTFAGMSMYKGIQNAMNFVMYVCIVILTILVVLIILLWFVLFPYVPMILTVISIIGATSMGGSVGGMRSAFCVAPGTLVKTKAGWEKVEKLVPGQELDQGSVEGIIVATSQNAECVSIDGVILSKTHLIFYQENWISAGEHPLAQSCPSPILFYCLNTTSRNWTVKGNKEEFLLRDWEELPDSDKSDTIWEEVIYEMLNRRTVLSVPDSSPGRGLLGQKTKVWHREKGVVDISTIKIGDFIQMYNDSYTEVYGIYNDTSEQVPLAGVNSHSWVWIESKSQWRHFNTSEEQTFTNGYQLITDSGEFNVLQGIDRIRVRDFTEVGWNRIHETYPLTSSILNSLHSS